MNNQRIDWLAGTSIDRALEEGYLMSVNKGELVVGKFNGAWIAFDAVKGTITCDDPRYVDAVKTAVEQIPAYGDPIIAQLRLEHQRLYSEYRRRENEVSELIIQRTRELIEAADLRTATPQSGE